MHRASGSAINMQRRIVNFLNCSQSQVLCLIKSTKRCLHVHSHKFHIFIYIANSVDQFSSHFIKLVTLYKSFRASQQVVIHENLHSVQYTFKLMP